MSSIVWILVGLLITHNGAAKTENVCTCQQSGLGPFGPSSSHSHHSAHGTLGTPVSSTEISELNGPSGSGNYMTQVVSSAEEAANSGFSGSNTEPSASNGPFGLGNYMTKAISSAAGKENSGILGTSSENSATNRPFGLGNYMKQAISSAAETLPSIGYFEHSGSSSHQHGSVTYGQSGLSKTLGQLGTTLFGPLETSSGTSKSSGSLGSENYVTYKTSSKTQAAEAPDVRPAPNKPDGGPDLLGPGPFGHSTSSSHEQASITFEQSGHSKSQGQGKGQNISHNNSAAPSEFESNGGGLVLSGSVSFQKSEPSSDHLTVSSVGLSDASSNQPGHGLVGLSESNSVQNGTRLLELSEESPGTSTSNGSFASGNYATHTTSSTEQMVEAENTGSFPNGQVGGGLGELGSGQLGNSGSSYHQMSVAEAEQTKFSQFGNSNKGSISPASISYGQSETSSDNSVTSPIGLSGASSDQSGSESPGPSGSSAGQLGANLFEPTEAISGTSTQSGLNGSGNYATYTTSPTAQTAEVAETRPSSNEPDGGGPGPLGSGHFGLSGSPQNVSVTFVQSGQSKSIGQGLGNFIKHSNSITEAAAEAAEIKASQIGLDEGGSVSSPSVQFGQSETSSNQQVTLSVGLPGVSHDQPESSQVGQSGYSAVHSVTGLADSDSKTFPFNGSFESGQYLKHATSSVGQTSEEPEIGPSPTGSDTGGTSPFSPESFGHSGSSSNQHLSVTFGELGQSKPFGEGLDKFKQYGHSAAETQPSQFGSDGGATVSSGSIAFRQPGTSSYQQISDLVGQYATSSDQKGRNPIGLQGTISVQNGSRLFLPSESSSGTLMSSGQYLTSSVGQMAEEPEAGPSLSSGPDTGVPNPFLPGPFGESGSSSNQHKSITFGNQGQSKSFGDGSEQFNHYSNSVAAETRPSQLESNVGGEVSSGSASFGQTLPSSYQQKSGSLGQHSTSSYQPGLVQIGSSGFSSGQNEASGANSDTSTSSGSFGSVHNLKYATPSVGQMVEEPQTAPSHFGPDTGIPGVFGLGPFEQSGSTSTQHISETFGPSRQSNSFGQGLGQYKQYSNSLAAETKPTQFGPVAGLAVSSGSAAFGQPIPGSYQQTSSLAGQYATSSGQPGSGSAEILGAGQLGQSKSFGEGIGQYNQYSNSVAGETKPSQFGPVRGVTGTSGSAPYGQPISSPYQKASGSVGQYTTSLDQPESGSAETIGAGQLGQSQSFGDGQDQYNRYSNAVAGETKTSQLRPAGGLTVSSESASFGQSAPNTYQQMSSSVGQYTTSSDKPGSGSAETLGAGQIAQSKSFGENLGQYNQYSNSVAGESKPSQFGPVGVVTMSSGSTSFGQPIPNTFQQMSGSYGQHTTSSDKPGSSSAETFGAGQLGQSKSFGEGLGQYNQYSNSVAGETKISQFGPEGGLKVSSGSTSFGQLVPNSYQQMSSSVGQFSTSSDQPGSGSPETLGTGQLGQTKYFGENLGQYNQYSNSVAGESKPSQFGPVGGVTVSSGSASFGQPVPNSYQKMSGSVGQYTTSSNQPGSGTAETLGASSDQSGTGLFRPSGASSGTLTQSGSLGPGHYVTYTYSSKAQTAEEPETEPSPIGSSGGVSYGHLGQNSHQEVSSTFGESGQFKSPEEGLVQYIPYANPIAASTEKGTEKKPSYFKLDGAGEVPPGSVSFLQQEPSSDQRIPSSFGQITPSLVHHGANMQYTTESGALAAEEAGTESSTAVKNGEGLGSTEQTSFWPSGHSSYKPVSVSSSTYGPTSVYLKAGSFGLSSHALDQQAPGQYEIPEQSSWPSGTSELLEQDSYVPHTLPSEAAVATAGHTRPGLFGLSESSNIISLKSGPYGLGPGFYVPYRNAGAVMSAISQAEPPPEEPYRGVADQSSPSSEQPAFSFISTSTPSSYEISTNQNTVVTESSGQQGSGHYNSHIDQNSIEPAPLEPTTMVAVSPVEKRSVLKSASRLSSLLTTARVSTAISYLLSSGQFNPSALSKVISYLIKSLPESQPGVPGNEIMLQALLELIASLVHILRSASVGQVGNCPSSSSSLVGQSLTHSLGS